MTKLKNKFSISLPIQLLIALVLGAAFGSLIKSGAGYL
jgi:large-conductance mechanosensitive channel